MSARTQRLSTRIVALFLVLLLAARGLSDTDHVDGEEDEA